MSVKITDLGAASLPLVGTEQIELAVSELESRSVAVSDLLAAVGGLDATFITVTANAQLPNERILTAGSGILIADGGAGLPITVSVDGTLLPVGTADFSTLRYDLGGGAWVENTAISLQLDSMFVDEKAASIASVEGRGQLWVRDDVPNTLMFTDDAGSDIAISTGVLPVGVTGQTIRYGATAWEASSFFTHNDLNIATFTNQFDQSLDIDISNSTTTILRGSATSAAIRLVAPLELQELAGGTDIARFNYLSNLMTFSTNGAGAQTLRFSDWDVIEIGFQGSIARFLEPGGIRPVDVSNDGGYLIFDLHTNLRGMKLDNSASLFFQEQAVAELDEATYGQVWVRDDTPNILMFTDDTGVDFVIGGSGTSTIDQYNYQFSTTLTMVDPGAGFLRLNNADPTLATQISISELTSEGVDIGVDIFANLNVGATIKIVDANDLTVYLMYTISSFFDDAGFQVEGIVHQYGTTIPADTANVLVEISRDPYLDMTAVLSNGSVLSYSPTSDSFVDSTLTMRLLAAGTSQVATALPVLELFAAARVQLTTPIYASYLSNTDALIMGAEGGNYSIHTGITSNKFLDLYADNGGQPVRIINSSTLMIGETAGDHPDIATFGQIWIRDRTPNQLWFTDDSGIRYPIATAKSRRRSNTATDMNAAGIAEDLTNGELFFDDGAAYTITLENSADLVFEVDQTFQIINAGSGVITLAEGIGDTLFVLDGAAGTVTDAAGSATLGTGAVATVKRSAAGTWLVWGSGITP